LADRKINELINALERAKHRLTLLEGGAAQRLMSILVDVEAEMIAALQDGLRGSFNLQKASALFNEVTRISENGLFAQQGWLQAEIPQVLRGALAIDQAQLGFVGFSAEDIRASFAAWEESNAYRELMNTGWQRWWNEVVGRNETMLRGLQKELTRGATLGLDGKTMSASLIESAKTMKLEVTNPQVWANRIVRTEMNRMSNDIHMGFAQEIGVDKFYNFGIGDARQSEICAEAIGYLWRASTPR